MARKKHTAEAGRRYQSTRTGKFFHAKRQQRYITRKNKMTHQGSKTLSTCVLLLVLADNSIKKRKKPIDTMLCCHFCGKPCSEFVRKGFLRAYPQAP
jgi:hypothetical protein